MFRDCNQLKTIALPSSLVRIGSGTFRDCNELTSITFPSSLRYIDDTAFYACRQLQGHLHLPSSVINVGLFAFSRCQKLQSITISTSMKELDEGIFAGCIQLRTVNIPDSIIKIGRVFVRLLQVVCDRYGYRIDYVVSTLRHFVDLQKFAIGAIFDVIIIIIIIIYR